MVWMAAGETRQANGGPRDADQPARNPRPPDRSLSGPATSRPTEPARGPSSRAVASTRCEGRHHLHVGRGLGTCLHLALFGLTAWAVHVVHLDLTRSSPDKSSARGARHRPVACWAAARPRGYFTVMVASSHARAADGLLRGNSSSVTSNRATGRPAVFLGSRIARISASP